MYGESKLECNNSSNIPCVRYISNDKEPKKLSILLSIGSGILYRIIAIIGPSNMYGNSAKNGVYVPESNLIVNKAIIIGNVTQ